LDRIRELSRAWGTITCSLLKSRINSSMSNHLLRWRQRHICLKVKELQIT